MFRGLGLLLGMWWPIWVEDVRMVVVCERRPDDKEDRIKREEHFTQHGDLIDEVGTGTGTWATVVAVKRSCREVHDLKIREFY